MRRKAAYLGVDVVVRGTQAGVDLEFSVSPSADPAAIALTLDGSRWRLTPPEIDGVRGTYRTAGGALRIDGAGLPGGSESVRIRVSLERSDVDRPKARDSRWPSIAAMARGWRAR